MDVQAFLRARGVPLRHVTLDFARAVDHALLAACAGTVETLHLHNMPSTLPDAGLLAADVRLPQLRVCELEQGKIGADAVQAVLNACPHLTELYVTRCLLQNAALTSLLSAPSLLHAHFTALNVASQLEPSRVGIIVVPAFAGFAVTASSTSLRTLTFTDCGALWFRDMHLPALQTLEIYRCRTNRLPPDPQNVDATLLDIVRSCPDLRHLTVASLKDFRSCLTSAFLPALATHCPRLETLDLTQDDDERDVRPWLVAVAPLQAPVF